MTVQVEEFERLRPHLLAVGYRLTGTLADAEDVVQDAWLRWDAHRAGRADTAIADLKAWLTTVVSRLALDRLRSAAHRRETYAGQWLPEPVVTTLDGNDPLTAVVAGEDARFAAMVVLENLTPDQRVAFVLHDGFAVPFDEIAGVLGTTPAAARQLASRARRAVSSAPPPAGDHDEVVATLMAAMAAGDLEAVVALLHPDVTFTGDANRRAPTAVQVIRGKDKVARFLLGLAQRYGPRLFEIGELALVNGELGVCSAGAGATADGPAIAPRIQALTVRDGQVVAVYDIANPDKFTGSPLRTTQ
ncbi:RNA polymerase sigma factor, sigma-70 family [Mycolicibacterium chubuense NBB4]|uniref:RNA polymerase sigma factor, sigma-70 family n=1 Tax=Mycolicibacterium chubuense (strain NBB4) TaxID=710421 RepID=I4BFC4_MYCCN|nr:sigma-70 family RNA polymerase sigma factor [Mycolicibacterium chubuense]AFM15981.1 RNA polymerase sigma factor, sigma-70 family [Mycolicibacterium chubuense NBB4]